MAVHLANMWFTAKRYKIIIKGIVQHIKLASIKFLNRSHNKEDIELQLWMNLL